MRDYNPNTKTGKGRPSEEAVEAIAKALNADVDEARAAAGYSARNGSSSRTYDLGDNARISLFGKNFTEEESAEIAEEMAISYEVILARRAARKLREEQGKEINR